MIEQILKEFENNAFDQKVEIFNNITEELYHFISIEHPCLNVHLVPVDQVRGNDYNPNKVAPPEMILLKMSIKKDGLTMPIVVADDEDSEKPYVVVDGFHRKTVVATDSEISNSLNGYVPVSKLNKSIEDRIASTVRHNMARGTHQVELSAKLVATLTKHNWSDVKIGQEIGMDPDEVLRMKQTTGLAELFKNDDFSKSWE